ncbi:hypothetical protein ACKWTF_000590 [Chironomus riparius]
MNITQPWRMLIRNLKQFRVVQISRAVPVIIRNHQNNNFNCARRNLCSVFSKSPDYASEVQHLELSAFEPICIQTLESLTEYFDEIVEADSKLVNGDVNYSDGVLTVKLGGDYGTYVINRQTPNRQIWLSSPISGPKRYDWINGDWIYKHDGVSLHALLQQELEKIMSVPVDFMSLKKM